MPVTNIGCSLNDGPVIYQAEDSLLEEDRQKKNLTLTELNHLFKVYLAKKNTKIEDVSVLSQISVIFNDPRFALWHTLDKSQQMEALNEIVELPEYCHELFHKIGTTAGDAQTVKAVIEDVHQNAVDSFSHAAFVQQKYCNYFPGFKLILFLHQAEERMILVVIDNGFGNKVTKPKKLYTGEEQGNDIVSRFVDWLIRRYVEKEGTVEREVAYTGGQGMALKKIKIELQLEADLHFATSGAVFELKLKNFF